MNRRRKLRVLFIRSEEENESEIEEREGIECNEENDFLVLKWSLLANIMSLILLALPTTRGAVFWLAIGGIVMGSPVQVALLAWGSGLVSDSVPGDSDNFEEENNVREGRYITSVRGLLQDLETEVDEINCKGKGSGRSEMEKFYVRMGILEQVGACLGTGVWSLGFAKGMGGNGEFVDFSRWDLNGWIDEKGGLVLAAGLLGLGLLVVVRLERKIGDDLDIYDTSDIFFPATEKINLDDSKLKVFGLEPEFEYSTTESLVSSDSELEEFPTRPLVSQIPEPESSSKAIKAVLILPDTSDIDPGTSLNLTRQMNLRPSGARMVDNRLTFTKIENKSEVMNALAIILGLSPALNFYDICSFTGMNSLKNIPRPVYALLFSIPFTSTWNSITRAKEMAKPPYKGSGPDQPVIWFKQAIADACGSMGLLHCLLNGQAHRYILPETILSRLYQQSIPLAPGDRAIVLYNDQNYEDAHQAIAALGYKAPPTGKVEKPRRHFVAFVRGEDGWLWEMDGTRGGPIRREPRLEEHEDLLTDDIMRFCMGGFVDSDSDEDTMCSCIALAKDPTEVVTLPLNSLSCVHLYNERSEGVQPRTFWDPAWYGTDHWS
ncbi:hypothetical protein BOTNAR_0405g00100 [Botryotinia narcissicola]|uniref:Ubiquitin carboxyl-terminal hydrolase n=1 Tax=Botryotinia narcissicola TaxID=278944 RepID=A0A4Z1HTZ9_9HELO|nr:hypothetical protein BOTNAR_0405g00100 [Botryotinia narcissicola]